jgi:recombination protein RecT
MSNQVSRVDVIKGALLPAQKQITSLLQDKERANKFMAASLVVASDRVLMGCNPDSVVQALVGVAMLDLSIDKNLGHCYILPYGQAAQLQLGYKGWIQLLYRAGWLVKCFPVYQCDVFSMSFDGWDNKVIFEPTINERDEGDKEWVYQNLRGVFVVSRNSETKDEFSTFVSKAIIEKLRKTSPNQKNAVNPSGIWKDWYVEMAQAKAIKKLAKMLPIGDSRAALALAADDKAEIGQRVDYSKTAEMGMLIDMETTPEPRSRSVESLVSGNNEAVIETPQQEPLDNQ